jgi:hypothetical protein
MVTEASRSSGDFPASTSSARDRYVPDLVIEPSDGVPVHLLLVTDWVGALSFHLAWSWLIDDVRTNLRQAYRLEDLAGRSIPVLDSRVMPLAGRMNEVTYFDTRDLEGPQMLGLRLRCRLAEPIPIPYG